MYVQFSQIYNSLLVQTVTGLFSSIFFTEATVAGSSSDPYAEVVVDIGFEVKKKKKKGERQQFDRSCL